MAAKLTIPLLAVTLLLTGCDSPALTAPTGAYLIPHDARFHSLWSKVESCSGITRDPKHTRRYIYPGDYARMPNGELVAAFYNPHGDFMVIAERLKDHDGILMHEMLHVLLIKVLGVYGHPEEYFMVRCGSVGSVDDS